MLAAGGAKSGVPLMGKLVDAGPLRRFQDPRRPAEPAGQGNPERYCPVRRRINAERAEAVKVCVGANCRPPGAEVFESALPALEA
jgi:hypothetical protein